MVEHHRATATEQMRQTGLMRGVDELPVGRPAVALQHTGIVGAEHPRRLRKAAPVFNRVGRGIRCRKCPQPVRMAADFPPGFIGRDDWTPTDLRTERVVGRLRLARGAMHRVDQPAPRDGEAEAIAEQMPDTAEGQSALFIEDHGERNRLRPELAGGRAERIRCLQRMPALHAPPTLPALADDDAKLVHDGSLYRQVFVVLRDDAPSAPRPRRNPDSCGGSGAS